jgi:hypothetical protein
MGVKGPKSEGESLHENRRVLKVQVKVRIGIKGFKGGGESPHES